MSMDLMDAYFHITVAIEHQPLLYFVFQGLCYQVHGSSPVTNIIIRQESPPISVCLAGLCPHTGPHHRGHNPLTVACDKIGDGDNRHLPHRIGVWLQYSREEVDLFAWKPMSHCHLRFSLTEADSSLGRTH